jgi:cytochrome c oxidase assembly protein subunit 15
MTGVLTTLVALLVVWIGLGCAKPHPARKAAGWVVGLLITEALLGALLVKGGYVEGNTSDARVLVQCIHFTNTMALLAALTLTAWWLSAWPRLPVVGTDSRSNRKMLAGITIAMTVIVGATGSVAALADTLFPSPSLRAALAQDFSRTAPLIIRTRWIHPTAAVVAVVLAVWLAIRLPRSRVSRVVILLSALQIALGFADVLVLAPVWMQIAHLLGADLFWIALVVLASEAFPHSQPGVLIDN